MGRESSPRTQQTRSLTTARDSPPRVASSRRKGSKTAKEFRLRSLPSPLVLFFSMDSHMLRAPPELGTAHRLGDKLKRDGNTLILQKFDKNVVSKAFPHPPSCSFSNLVPLWHASHSGTVTAQAAESAV